MKWIQLFLSRSCVNNCSGLQLRAELGAFIHRSVSKKLGSWEVSVALGLGAATATTRKLIIHKLIWQNSSYLMHCIFVLHGHQH